jgi:predicted nucleic acid-binding protein
MLPDTCAWIDFFRGRQTPLAQALEQALRNGTVVTCGVVQYELMQGVKGAAEGKAILGAFQAVPFLEVSQELWIEAGHLASQLRSKGHTLPLSDILIATLAKKHSATLLTIDGHFSAIPGLKVAAS